MKAYEQHVQQQADQARRTLAQIAREKILPDFWKFVTFVRTEDPHAQDGQVVRPLPLEKIYVKRLLSKMLKHKRLMIKKPRQVLCTWLALAVPPPVPAASGAARRSAAA